MIGTAGSEKSLLIASFSNWMKMKEQDVVTVNLDAGAMTLPHSPDVDIRNYFSVEGLMERYGLGPNGALLLAADLIPESLVERIVDGGSNPETLKTAIEEQISGSTQLLTRDIAQALSSIGLSLSLIPVSAKDTSGFIDFHALSI